ncbi:MAG: hypothetical protein ACRDD8_10275 [Bacteroidales bacterium]
MAQKYVLTNAILADIKGVLDRDEEGNRVVIVDGVAHDLEVVLDSIEGAEITLKATNVVEEE